MYERRNEMPDSQKHPHEILHYAFYGLSCAICNLSITATTWRRYEVICPKCKEWLDAHPLTMEPSYMPDEDPWYDQ